MRFVGWSAVVAIWAMPFYGECDQPYLCVFRIYTFRWCMRSRHRHQHHHNHHHRPLLTPSSPPPPLYCVTFNVWYSASSSTSCWSWRWWWCSRQRIQIYYEHCVCSTISKRFVFKQSTSNSKSKWQEVSNTISNENQRNVQIKTEYVLNENFLRKETYWRTKSKIYLLGIRKKCFELKEEET